MKLSLTWKGCAPRNAGTGRVCAETGRTGKGSKPVVTGEAGVFVLCLLHLYLSTGLRIKLETDVCELMEAGDCCWSALRC
jgi:hypothetical protein